MVTLAGPTFGAAGGLALAHLPGLPPVAAAATGIAAVATPKATQAARCPPLARARRSSLGSTAPIAVLLAGPRTDRTPVGVAITESGLVPARDGGPSVATQRAGVVRKADACRADLLH